MKRTLQLDPAPCVELVGVHTSQTDAALVARAGESIVRGSHAGDIDSWRKSALAQSKVPRARSGAFATAHAALLARSFLQCLDGPLVGAATGVAVASSTSTTQVAYRYESTGAREGWALVDPFGLANAVTSAIAAQTALTLRLHAFAVSFLGDSVGFFSALSFAAVAICRKRAANALVLAANEVGPVQQRALAALSMDLGHAVTSEGAAGMLLTSWSDAGKNWRLQLIGSGGGPFCAKELPDDWHEVPITWLADHSPIPWLGAMNLPIKIGEMLTRSEDRLVIAGGTGRSSWWACGFARTALH